MDPDRNDVREDETATAEGVGRPSDAQPSITWSRLVLIEEIGTGSFGRVYRAFDPTLEREVALKLITLPDADPAATAASLREGRMLARVRHPNVVTVYGADLDAGQIGIWMELVRGRSFADVVRRDGTLGPEEAALAGVALCRALAAVHAAGLLHRDIKPANLMREAGGRVVLMDFGAGRDALGPARPSGGDATGTPVCMAPEVLIGQSASPASDVYSVGALLFFLVSGRYPIEGRTLSDIVLAHSMGRRRLLVDCRPDLPERFIEVVERALAADPRRRYQTAGAMMQALLETMPADRASSEGARGGAIAGEAAGAANPAGAQALELPLQGDLRRERSVTPSRLRRRAAALAGALATVWVLGFLTTMGFNVVLGRSAGYAGETPLAWFVWGLRSLVMPAVLAIALLVVALVLASTWRLAATLSQGFRRWSEKVGATAAAWLARSKLASPTVAGSLVVVLQLLAVFAFWRRFRLLIAGIATTVDRSPLEALSVLGPDHFAEHDLYRQSLTAIVLVTAVAWYGVYALARHRRSRLDRPTLVAGIGLGILSILLLEIPYRVMIHNEFERVAHGLASCYQIGERADTLLLYCPATPPPRNRLVPRDDPSLRRLNVVESIFTPPGAKEPR